MRNAQTIAKAFLQLSDPDVGDVITHLKLQKLLYYAQGFYLAIYNEPLFKEEVLAWEHGPVVREVFDIYKGRGSNPIEHVSFKTKLTKKEESLIVQVWNVYGQFSAWKLREMTHNEEPWKQTEKDGVIKKDLMKSHFKTLVVDE